MSLGVFFLILKYAFQETELRCPLLPQRPLLLAARNTWRTRQTLKLKIIKLGQTKDLELET